MQAGIGVDHADRHHPGKIETLGHQLGSDQDVALTPQHLFEDQVGRIASPDRVPIQAQDAGGGKQRPHLLLDPFGADAEGLDGAAAAGGTADRHRFARAAVMAFKAGQAGVVDEGHAAVSALADGAAVAALDAGDGQVHEGRPVADGQGAEAARDLAAVDDPRRAAGRAATGLGALTNGEDHGPALVSGAGVLVAADAEGVVQEAGGHADLPVLESLNATPSGASMSTLFNPGARLRRMNRKTVGTIASAAYSVGWKAPVGL